jgi:polysaccharide export outer membrane protein
MLRIVLTLIMAGTLVASSPVLSRAGGEDISAPPGSEAAATPETSPTEGAPDASSYLIGPGDVLDVAVWKDEALTRSCIVRPDGAISFPLIGEVRVEGRTVADVKEEMEKRLDRYVPGTTLSVEVKQVNSMIIYVIGKVNAPGRYIMNTNVNVLQALATAGGLNIFAKRNKIKIFRQEDHETVIFPFEYDEVVEGKRLDRNIMLKRGDIVVIP